MKLILLAFAFSLSTAKCQLPPFDIAKDEMGLSARPRLIYLTALWCKPCMAKIDPILLAFGKRSDLDLIVLFDRTRLTDKSTNILVTRFDTSCFRSFPERYYLNKKYNGGIKGTSFSKPIKTFVSDINGIYKRSYTTNEIWVGVALLQIERSLFVINVTDLNQLKKKIDDLIETNHP